jgi:hypothetical protein
LKVIFILWSLSVHKWKKSGGFKSGEFASHGTGPSRPHQWLLHVSSKNSLTVRAQCGGTLYGHPSCSYSNKLLRDTYINFLYTTVHFSNISKGSPCITDSGYPDCRHSWPSLIYPEKSWDCILKYATIVSFQHFLHKIHRITNPFELK